MDLFAEGEVLNGDAATHDVGPLRVHVSLHLGEILRAKKDPTRRQRDDQRGWRLQSEQGHALEAGLHLLDLRWNTVAADCLDA